MQLNATIVIQLLCIAVCNRIHLNAAMLIFTAAPCAGGFNFLRSLLSIVYHNDSGDDDEEEDEDCEDDDNAMQCALRITQ